MLALTSVSARAVTDPTSAFRYQRAVMASGSGIFCAVVDPAIFAHAAPAMRDLRLFSATPATTEAPYLLTVSEAQQTESESARVLHLEDRGPGGITLDLAMPPRPYTDVVLDLPGRDFIATVHVLGQRNPDAASVELGHFPIFDLTSQHLGRDTTLHLQESTFPVLRLQLHFWKKPDPVWSNAEGRPILRGAGVPPSRERQTLFDTALSAPVRTAGHTSVARFMLPPHLPVERVLVALAPAVSSEFSRTVRVTALPVGGRDPEESIAGSITRVHRTEAGQDLEFDQLSVDATLGANLQTAAEAEVTVENGADAPLPILSVALQTRRRSLCFQAGSRPLTLFYGDSDLREPERWAGLSVAGAAHAGTAELGPERTNPAWRPEPPKPQARRQQPAHLVWIVLLGLAMLLGVVALRATRVVRH